MFPSRRLAGLLRCRPITLVIAIAALCPSAVAHPTITREHVLVWIEPDQETNLGVFDWSARMRPVATSGLPGFDTDHIPLDGVDDALVVDDAITPAALTEHGFTILAVFRCPTPQTPGRCFFSLRDANGQLRADCTVGPSGTVVGRCDFLTADGDATTASVAGTVLPASIDFPGAISHEFLAAIRWDPSSDGTFRVSLVRAGDDAAQVAATTATQTERGTPAIDNADLVIARLADESPGAFGQWSLLRIACFARALSDAELADMVPADAPPTSFTQLPLSQAEGFIDHFDPERLHAPGFQSAVWTALTRNVHIVIGPGESHCGSGALSSSSVPGLDNLLKHACGRATGLSGCGLTGFEVLPLNPITSFSSVHHVPFTTSALAPAWAASNGTIDPTTGLWDTLGDPSVRKSTPAPGPRSTAHLQRQSIVQAHKSTAGINAMEGMANPWSLFADERFDSLSLYANSDNATGTYRIAGLIDGGDHTNIAHWTTDGPPVAIPPDHTLMVQRLPLDPSWDGFAIENINGVGQGLRMGFFDVHSPDPGIRIGCTGLAVGGGRVEQINTQVWFPLSQSAHIDYLGLCLSITNDSSRPTPISAWWHDTQHIVRNTVALSGPDGAGGPDRAHGIWIPPEGNLLPDNRTRQRIRADLLASLAVELDIDLVSFPAFVPTFLSGATNLYSGVHMSASRFGTFARLFEQHVMPWQVPELTGACCFTCAAPLQDPCPTTGALGPACVGDVTRPTCEETLHGVFRGTGSLCTDPLDLPVCRCLADISADGLTNALDFNLLATNFGAGSPDCAIRIRGDLNCDGVVNALDFNILAGDFGCQ